MKKNYRLDITLTFVLFSLFIITVITYLVMFYWTKLSQDEFHYQVTLSSKNIINELRKKEYLAKNSANAILNATKTKDFTLNQEILSIVFKTFLSSNDDFIKIGFIDKNYKYFCKKQSKNIKCQNQDFNNELVLGFKIEKLNATNDKVIIESEFQNYLKHISDKIFKLIVIDEKGNILFSNFLQTKSLFDLFHNNLAKEIIISESKFITNDIYVEKFNKYRFIFLQNKNLLKKQKQITKNIAITILFISVLVSILFGYLFSKPLYEFYDELNERVKKEIEKNREKEQMLMHQNKLAALGEMLGNIAHQWRHPITRLSLLIQNFELAYQMGKLDEGYMQKFKSKSFEQIEYMSNTIDDFTSFFKKDKEKQLFYVDEVVEQAIKLLEARLNDVNIIKLFESKVKIDGYKTEFSQVILNILNNAVDALNEKNIKNKNIKIKITSEFIEIEDNAGGIDIEIIDKIFEPYFTTKFQSQGTGIGLYMSKVIITKHFNFKLLVENSKEGALFKIVFSE